LSGKYFVLTTEWDGLKTQLQKHCQFSNQSKVEIENILTQPDAMATDLLLCNDYLKQQAYNHFLQLVNEIHAECQQGYLRVIVLLHPGSNAPGFGSM
jgi:hypothetical protein